MKAGGTYHSPLRASQAAATSERIVAACVALMHRGADLTYALVAAEAEVQERTVYRHFPTKEDLQAALWDWIIQHLTHADFAARNEEQLVAAMRESFAGFDAGAPLIQAMLRSPQGLEVRRRQQPVRRAMFQACLDSAIPGVPPPVREHAAAVLQVLYSAASWDLLRSFWDMDADQAADTIELGIRSLLSGLRQHAPPPDHQLARGIATASGGNHDAQRNHRPPRGQDRGRPGRGLLVLRRQGRPALPRRRAPGHYRAPRRPWRGRSSPRASRRR
jgi:AcrR family transcriptional regulator